MVLTGKKRAISPLNYGLLYWSLITKSERVLKRKLSGRQIRVRVVPRLVIVVLHVQRRQLTVVDPQRATPVVNVLAI